MRRVEVDGHDRGGICQKIIHDVAAAGRDRHHPALCIEAERLEIDVGVFPDLVVDEVLKPRREHPVENAAGADLPSLDDRVRDQGIAHEKAPVGRGSRAETGAGAPRCAGAAAGCGAFCQRTCAMWPSSCSTRAVQFSTQSPSLQYSTPSTDFSATVWM